MAEEQGQALRKEEVLAVLSQIATQFRTRLGESLSTVEKHNTPLADATTPSLEALKAFSTAWRVHSSSGPAAAMPLYQRAIELDPKFALAYAWLGDMYGQMGESDRAAENITRAYQLRDRTTDAEKFLITAFYDIRVTGNMEKAEQTCLAWAQTYPRVMPAHGFLSGVIYQVLGRYEEAIDQGKKALALDPGVAAVLEALVSNYICLGQIQEAENTLETARDHKVESTDLSIQRYQIAFLKGDDAGMEQAQARGQERTEGLMAYQEAFALAYSGHLQQARGGFERASKLAQQSGRLEGFALLQTGGAVVEALSGSAPLARQKALAALASSKDREVEYGAALALALAGDSARAQTLVNDLEKRFPEDTSVKFSYAPTLHALLAIGRGDSAWAIDQLQIAVPFELSMPRSASHGNFGALYPVYVRGTAYLAARQGAKAAAEFQKILSHRGIVSSDPIGATAILQLGRAYALAGDPTRAKNAYQDFLKLWKDADPDLPILKQAKLELAKLP